MIRFALLLFLAAFLPTVARSLSLAPLFSDGMVLQRELPVSVWGLATPGERVTVEFAGQSVSTVAASDGRWSVRLGPLIASSQPRVLTVRASTTIELRDVLVGEVWICAGQSNIARRLGPAGGQKPIPDWEAVVAAGDHPWLRVFTVGRQAAPEGPASALSGGWIVTTPQTAIDVSAVGYFFARDLHAHHGVPVGLVVSAVGGTPIEGWISREALASAREKNPALRTSRRIDYDHASAWFNGMIAPLIPHTARGLIWYQGESNRDEPLLYRDLLATLIHDWRARWGQPHLPFLFVQLPSFEGFTPELREAQREVHRATASTALIVTTDVGDARDIHPVDKKPVGRRLALAARALGHGEPVLWGGPVPSRTRVEGSSVILYFDFTAGGLDTSDAAPLRGFELAGPDGIFHPASATLLGDRVRLASENVRSPSALRHGWAPVPDTNLVNTHGLPAGPFIHPISP
jgi:sialate O-acetylesterase